MPSGSRTADPSAGGVTLLRDNLGQFNFAAAAEQGGILSEPTRVVADADRYQPSIMTFGQIGDGGGLVLTRNFQPFWRNTGEGPGGQLTICRRRQDGGYFCPTGASLPWRWSSFCGKILPNLDESLEICRKPGCLPETQGGLRDYSVRNPATVKKRRETIPYTLTMKKTLLLAAALSCLAMLGGCYQAQKQTPSPMGSEDTNIEERTIAGPYQEDLPGSAGASPSGQQAASRDAGAALESETSGAMKPPALEAIDSRIAAYGKKFARWNALNSASAPSALNREQAAEMADCYQQMKQLLAGYSTLRSAVESGDRSDVAANSMYGMKMQELQRTDLEFVEGTCGSLLSESAMPQQAAMAAGAGTAGPSLEAELVSQSAAKNYKGVIQAWQQIPVDQQEQVSARGRVLYAEALVYLQKEEEAAEIYRGMVEKMESDTDRPPDIFLCAKPSPTSMSAPADFPRPRSSISGSPRIIWP